MESLISANPEQSRDVNDKYRLTVSQAVDISTGNPIMGKLFLDVKELDRNIPIEDRNENEFYIDGEPNEIEDVLNTYADKLQSGIKPNLLHMSEQELEEYYKTFPGDRPGD